MDTHWDVGSDEGYDDRIIATGIGPGESIDHTCSVWRRDVTEPTTVVLGALGNEKFALPAVDVEQGLLALESAGVVLRGTFTPGLASGMVGDPTDAAVVLGALAAKKGEGAAEPAAEAAAA